MCNSVKVDPRSALIFTRLRDARRPLWKSNVRLEKAIREQKLNQTDDTVQDPIYGHRPGPIVIYGKLQPSWALS